MSRDMWRRCFRAPARRLTFCTAPLRLSAVIAAFISTVSPLFEMEAAITALKRNGALLLGVSGNPDSWLAKVSDEFLYAGVEREGSPLNFEPRASILAEIYTLAA